MSSVELNCPVCGAGVTIVQAAPVPMGACAGCGTTIQIQPPAFAALAVRPPHPVAPPAQAAPPEAPPDAAPDAPDAPDAPESPDVPGVQGDLVMWDDAALEVPSAAPPPPPPPPPSPPPVQEAPAAEAPKEAAPAATGKTVEVVFDDEDEEKAGMQTTTRLDLFEPQGGRHGVVVDQYFRRSPYAGRRLRRRLLLALVGITLLCVLTWMIVKRFT